MPKFLDKKDISIFRTLIMERNARKNEIIKLFASTTGRPQLEKELKENRKRFEKARLDYDKHNGQLAGLQQKVEDCRNEMAAARKNLGDIHSCIQTMDLTGANAIRERGDERNYMINNKEYSVDTSDADDIKITPWTRKKKNDSPETSEESFEEDEDSLDWEVSEILNNDKWAPITA